jgi:hypothetical protein
MDNNSPNDPFPPPVNEPPLLFRATIIAAVFVGIAHLIGGFPATIGESIFLWIVAT